MKPALRSNHLPLQHKQMPYTHKQYLALSIPLTISAVSTPLLGAVDTAVVGHLPDPAFIGGVAIGSLIFNTLYWLLGFLRMSTSGFTAQAYGANQTEQIMLHFVRPLLFSILFGVIMVVCQYPIREMALWLMDSSPAVEKQAGIYFDIRIWGAPFALMNYAILGWLLGLSKVRQALFLQIGMNVLNILLDVLFVLVLHMGVKGVGLASLIAEVTAVMLGFLIIYRSASLNLKLVSWAKVVEKAPLIQMIKMNRDLFIRTICLLSVFGLFTAQGARMGETMLAANAILLQIQFMMAYLFDGMANGSSILIGRSIGEKNRALYQRVIKLSAYWGFIVSVLISVSFFWLGEFIVSLFTSIPEVHHMALDYQLWLCLFPLVVFWGLQLNGIFSGATEAGPIRDSLIISLLVYLTASWLLIPWYGNHGLWAAFILFSLARSIVLGLYVPRIGKKIEIG